MVTRGTKRKASPPEEAPQNSRPKRTKKESSGPKEDKPQTVTTSKRPTRAVKATTPPAPKTKSAPKKTTTKKTAKAPKTKAQPKKRSTKKKETKEEDNKETKEEDKKETKEGTTETNGSGDGSVSVSDDPFYETENSDVHTWRGWKEIFLVGTEWHNYEQVWKVRWDFDHLHEKLEEPLAKKPFDVYLWGTTEPQMVQFKSGRETIVYIPVIIAVVTTHPPPSTVGITSVMRTETFVPFKDFKLNWVPFSFAPVLPIQPSTVKKTERPDYYALQCGQRQKAVKSLSEIKSTNYSYVLPYIFFPDKPSDDINTNVNIVTTMGGKGVTFEYDWEMDDLEEVLKEVKEEHEFDDTQMSQLKEILDEEVKKAKQKNRDKRAERKAKIDGMPAAEKESLKTIQFLKFYPQNKDPNISIYMNPFINRYYGKAHKVYPEISV